MYQISITGAADPTDATAAEAVENQIADALSSALAGLPATAGLETAVAAFDFIGTVNLIAPATPDPKDELDSAVAKLSDALAELDPTDPKVQAVLDAAKDVDEAVTAYELAEPETPVTPPSVPTTPANGAEPTAPAGDPTPPPAGPPADASVPASTETPEQLAAAVAAAPTE